MADARQLAATLARAALVAFVSAQSACRPGADTARGTAERFIDQYYVRIDLAAAREYASGIAEQKIAEEERLVGDEKIDEGTRRPRVTYELKEERQEGEDLVLVYRARFDVDGAGSFERRLLITVRQTDAGWKVSNFLEFE